MNSTMMSIDDIKLNPSNPRSIKDHKFKQLVKSIQDFPEMLNIRPMVVNADMIVLGGNMRLQACKEAGLKEVPVIIATELTDEQQREFIIKDNIGYGEWDWDMLANTWDVQLLGDWGLDVIDVTTNLNMDEFFENKEDSKEGNLRIVLEYTEEEYNMVIDLFNKHSGSKESIVMKLLME